MQAAIGSFVAPPIVSQPIGPAMCDFSSRTAGITADNAHTIKKR
jgi:hypothetical protein